MVASAPLLLLLQISEPYAGSERCASCHAEQFRKQSKSHHASALRPILSTDLAEKLVSRPLAERSGPSFDYERAANGLKAITRKDGEEAQALLEWTFGSGAQGQTPVGRADKQFFEHRVSWYQRSAKPGITFGHPTEPPKTAVAALGQLQTADAIERCFNCHATGVRPGPDLTTMRPGVTCERCHGPGAAHVAKPGQTNIRNPAKLDAAAQVRFCGECHRLPTRTSAAPELEDPLSVRFAPIGLIASRCYQRTGRLTCVTCHDSHADADPSPAHYTAKCQGCHTSATTSTCPRKPDCITCHMPRVRPVPDLQFTDHRIRVPSADSTDWTNIQSAISAGDWNRARSLLERMPAKTAGWHILASKAFDGLNDPARAVAEAEAALALEPRNEAAHLQLGQVFLAHNTPEAAIEIFSEGLAVFPGSLMLRLGRGLARKDLQRFDEAEQDLRACLKKVPALALAFDALATLLIQGRRYDEAKQLAVEFRIANPSDFRGTYFLAAALEGEKQVGADIEGLLQESLRLNGSFAAAWALLGKVLLRSDKTVDAVAPLERAIALRPDLAAARLQMAEAYRKLGRASDAQREFEAVRELKEKERQPPPKLQYRRLR